MHLLLTLATLPATSKPPADGAAPAVPEPPLADVLAAALQDLCRRVDEFRQQPVSPLRTQQFAQQLQHDLRDLGRRVVQWTYNHLEPAVQHLCKHVRFEASSYTRLNRKTPQPVWTLFGPIPLWRVGYRPTDKSGDPTRFPLTLGLGLVQGASPALAGQATQLLSEAGMTPQRTLTRLQQEHGVGWGVKKLRQVTATVAEAMRAQQQDAQADKLLTLLGQASAGTGPQQPVLRVGRDGITLGVRGRGGAVFEVATTATVSVLDRRGRRLGTVYLAYTPESGQGRLSQALTGLLEAVLQRWQGPRPRLCYVTAAGDNETSYYEQVLCAAETPAPRGMFGVAAGGGLLSRQRAAVDHGRVVVRQGAAVGGVGAEDATVVAEGGWGEPRAALGSGLARAVRTDRAETRRLPEGVPLAAAAHAVPALRGVPPAGGAVGQWGHRSGVQNGVHAAVEIERQALAEGGSATDLEPAGGAVERGVGARV
jgi:hypothetical protein